MCHKFAGLFCKNEGMKDHILVNEAMVRITGRGKTWVRLRVRGLLRNPALAQQMLNSAPQVVQANAATGTLRAPCIGAHDAQFWCEWAERAAAQVTPRAASRKTRASTPPAARQAGESVATDWHARTLSSLRASLGNSPEGLGADEAAIRLGRDGPNAIEDVHARTDSEILIDQFRSVPVALLAGSGAISLATRAWAEAGAIATVLGANAALGFSTERKAEQTVSALRHLGAQQARVRRGGRDLMIDARELVVGDLLVLRPGDAVGADARLIEAHRLAANEAALSGESLPVRKEVVEALPAETALAERRNQIFMGTVISGGTGVALVVATGERTLLGRIRSLAQDASAPRTQLQEQLDRMGRRLGLGAAVLCGGVFAVGLLRGRPMLPLLRTAVSLGVAAIPEGLPTVATSLLAHSVRSLRERDVYARSLDAIENLGAVDTVCFDKTGTLTQNRMSVVSIGLGTAVHEAGGTSALPEAGLQVAMLCHSVERVAQQDGAGWHWEGSSTEIAILEYAQARGADWAALHQAHPVVSMRQRSEHHPYMVTLHRRSAGLLVAVKGRPDAVLERCDQWFDGRGLLPLSPATRRRLLDLNDALASRGQRVLALAWREHETAHYGDTAGLTWAGLVGLADPLRPELPAMVKRFQAAGIRPLMITGDQVGTAEAVAREIGLVNGQAHMLIDAAQLPESADELAPLFDHDMAGFARTSPRMKLEIVRALQQRGHVVAMTGDGINDGPALKTADVGVAMGVSGTDFAHAMSDLVLRSDHPAAMLEAVEQGRTAFLNIRKSVRYLVATNLSELSATALAVAVGLPEPFDPMALLWTNLVTDIWPAIALGLEPPEPGVMERPPVSLAEGLLDGKEWATLGTDAGVFTACALASYAYGLTRYGPGPQARTIAFNTLTVAQLLYALAMRSPHPLRQGGLKPNRALRRALVVSLAAQAGTVLLPPLRRLLGTTPLGPADLLVVLTLSFVPLVVREGLKERAAAKESP